MPALPLQQPRVAQTGARPAVHKQTAAEQRMAVLVHRNTQC